MHRTFFSLLFCVCYTALVGANTQTSPNLIVNPNCALSFSTGWSGAAWTCGNTGFYYYFSPGVQTVNTAIIQDVDITPFVDYITAGTANGVFTGEVWTYGADRGDFYVSFLTSAKAYISTWSSGSLQSESQWTPQTLTGAAIPSTARYARIQLLCEQNTPSSNCDAYFRKLTFTVTYSVATNWLLGSLTGGRGSDYQPSTSLLYFVESTAGTFSTYSYIRPLNNTAFTGVRTITANQSLSLLYGTTAGGGQIAFDYTYGLSVRPLGTCKMAGVGYVAYDPITQATLQNFVYSQKIYIPFGQLQPGYVFAVYNYDKSPVDYFDYVKIQVTAVSTVPPLSITLNVTSYNLVGKTGKVVRGYGYSSPQDIKLSADGNIAYITEDGGNLVRVDLNSANLNKSAATVLTTGLINPRELQIDDAHNIGYTVEYTTTQTGKLWAIDLVSGLKNIIISNLYYSQGILIDNAVANAYVSEYSTTLGGYAVSKVSLTSGIKYTYAPTYWSNIYSLTWADATQGRILLTVPGYYNIHILSITSSPATSTQVATITSPYSVVVVSPGQLLVVQDTSISTVTLNDPNFNYLGPTLLGIGNVPVTAITGGYATTSPSYFYYVQNSPFGGTLPIMVNYEKARALNAATYQILYDGVPQTTPWNDYVWDTTQNTFVVQQTVATAGRFPIRQVGAIWYNYWLGYYLDTLQPAFPDNMNHNITVTLYDSAGYLIPGGTSSVVIMIDNNYPHAFIQSVLYTMANGTTVSVGACDIVQGTSDSFSFVIDASDLIGQNLLSYSLVAYWGANKAAVVASDTYSPGHSSSVNWLGPYYNATAIWHATVPGDPTSKACAHTFALGVWDRSINRLGYIHYSSYQISITLLLS